MVIETIDGQVQSVKVVSPSAKGMTIELPDVKGTMLIPMERIKAWRMAPPPSWKQAEQAIKEGKAEKAPALMREYAHALQSLLAIPKGDASSYVFKYADLLRSRGDYKQAIAFIEQIPANVPAEIRAQSIIVSAYCRAMLGDADGAETQLNLLRAPTRRSALFTLFKLTRARIAWIRKDLVTALDEIASVIALKRLGSEAYAEALYLSAEAYEALGAAIARQKEAIASDDKLRRLYEQNRGEAFDALGIIRSDKSSVSAIMDEPPDLPGVSIEIRKQLVLVFPTSPWAALAKAKLPPGALDKLAVTKYNQPEGAKVQEEADRKKPKPTPTPEPDDGRISTETESHEQDNL